MNDAIRILVIDDNEDDRMLYRRCLQKSGQAQYDIAEADNGEEGLRRLEEYQPHCILLDYSLPGRNGIEVLKHIRESHPFIAVVMMTGQGNENVAVAAMQQGAQNYIAKSTVTAETLEHVIRMAIEHCLLQKRIDEQRASLEIFTRALAHDLKEPVRTIRSFVELLDMQENFSPKARSYFTYIQNAAARMHLLIDTVFLYTRLDDPGKMQKTNCDSAIVLQEVKENLHQLIRERNATILADELPVVHANRTQMIQLLQNLIANAINHAGQPVTIRIATTAQDDHWLFRVSDNGPGVSACAENI
jgi:signal transduction histidine kinase